MTNLNCCNLNNDGCQLDSTTQSKINIFSLSIHPVDIYKGEIYRALKNLKVSLKVKDQWCYIYLKYPFLHCMYMHVLYWIFTFI